MAGPLENSRGGVNREVRRPPCVPLPCVPPPCAHPVPARTCSLAPVDERQRAVIVGVAALAPSSTVQAHLGASAKRSHGTEYRIHPCPTPQWAQTFRALSPDTVLNQKVTRMA